MAWPKGKKRGSKKQQAAMKVLAEKDVTGTKQAKAMDPPKKKPMGPPPSKELAFYLERIEDLEHKGRGLYIGKCPKCEKHELRVFDEDPVEVRCAKCKFWAFGADQFAKFTEKLKVEVDHALQKGEEGQEEIQEVAG